MIRAVLFDAAGTLIHLREPVGGTYARFAREHGVDVSAARLQAAFPAAFRAMPPLPAAAPDRAALLARERDWWRDLVRAVFDAAGAAWPAGALEPCFDRLFAHFGTAAAWCCAAGAHDALRALRGRGLRTGIVSNFDHRLPPLLDALALSPLLDCVVLPGDAGAAKPDPRIFARALLGLGVAAAEAVYVGDDPRDDLDAARRAGLRAIDVTALADLRAVLDAIA